MKTATLKFVGVGPIEQVSNFRAEATLNCEITDPNLELFGCFYPNGLKISVVKAILQKYDDGWRVKAITAEVTAE